MSKWILQTLVFCYQSCSEKSEQFFIMIGQNNFGNKIPMFAKYIFLPFKFTWNKKCYKMLYEIIVSTRVKSKKMKTNQMNYKDFRKKLLGYPITPCFYFLSLCRLIKELEIRQYESTKLQKSWNYRPSIRDQITLTSLHIEDNKRAR